MTVIPLPEKEPDEGQALFQRMMDEARSKAAEQDQTDS